MEIDPSILRVECDTLVSENSHRKVRSDPGKRVKIPLKSGVLGSVEEVRGLKVVKIRGISRRQARKEILEYLEKMERAWSSEIADALHLDLSLVNRTLEKLWREKKVEPTTQQVHRKRSDFSQTGTC